MTVLVGVISQKGGVSKSTIARLIAREYAASGWDVKIADLDIRVRVALEPKCTLTANSCDNNKISTFFNASSSPFIQVLSRFFL